MRLHNIFIVVCLFLFSLPQALFAGNSPCSATNYQLSDFGIIRNYNLDNGTFMDLPDPSCGDYQGQDFWVTFTGPSSGLISIELIAGSITDAAFEVYWNACNGLAAPVGCFMDRNCGAEEMPGANLEVIPGETYHVRIFQEGGGTGDLGFRMSDLGGTDFTLGGTAQVFDSGVPDQNCFQLTTETTNQVGCAWFDTPIDFASGFEINYQLFFGDIDNGGADGIAFVFHTDPTPPCSATGGQLGFVGISPSFIVEFDTWTNGNFGDNIPQDHVAINLDGVFATIPIAQPVPIGVNGNVEDGLWHDVSLKWDPITNLFQVYFDGEQKISVNVAALTNNVFVAGTPVFWGLTASTGAAFNNQRFCFDGFKVENTSSVETRIDAKICQGQPYVFGTEVIFDPGVYSRPFEAANGCDSTVTLNLEIVEIEISGIQEVELPCDDDASVVQLAALVEANVDASTLSFSWDTDDGIITSDENTLTPIVGSVGTYTLTVENNPEGCEAEFSVVVSIAEPPEVDAIGGILGCIGDSLFLSCNAEDGLLVAWTTSDGNILGDPNVPNPAIDSLGTYTVTVTDPITGCSSSASTTVGGGGGGDAGPDIFYCIGEDGELVLQGSAFGDILGVQWSPATNLSDPNIINPSILNLNGIPETYSLTICNKTGPNLIVNGDFADGNTGFTSDYVEGVGQKGAYLITDDPKDFFQGFGSCDDNSADDDQMMVIDSDNLLDQNFWCQEVQVEPGAEYMFSAWFATVCSNCNNNYPLISLLVDGQEVNTPEFLNTPTCEWTQMQSDVFIANTNTIEICMTNLFLSAQGNDFALDDIELFNVCKIDGGECQIIPYDEVDVTIDPAEIACQEDQILELNATALGANGTNISFSWEVIDENGIYLGNTDSSSPTVQGPGTYIVTVVNDFTGCSAVDSIVLVEGTPDLPDFTLFSDGIRCPDNIPSIFILDLDEDTDYLFNWDGPGSNFTVTDDGHLITMDPGEYTVTVTNASNNCSSEETITIFLNNEIPEIEIEPLPVLTCKDQGTEIELQGVIYSISGDPVIGGYWFGPDQQLISTDANSIIVTEEGVYTFGGYNELSGCGNSAFIEVEFDLTPPEANISPVISLDCDNPITNISIDVPDGSDYSYAWSSDIGGFEGDTDLNEVTINSAGTYEVTVFDNATGCDTILSVTVDENLEPPIYTPNIPDELNCNLTQVDLSIDGTNLSFEWQTNANIISGLNNNSVTVNGEGTFEVLITNNDNGCTETETFTVLGDFTEPIADAGNSLTFGCTDTSLELSGSSVDGVSAEWQTAGGIILDGQDSFTPSIGGAGTYYLVVTGANGCTSRDSVIVNADTDLPTISAPESIVLDCNNPILSIDATGSSNGAEFTFEWLDAAGNVITDFTTLNPQVSAAGQYQLNILNTINNCDASTIVNVLEDFAEPDANISPATDLSCDITSSTFGLELDNPDWSYSWSDENGTIDGENQFQLTATDRGTFTLLITNEVNGCTNEFSFMVDNIASMPSLDFAGPVELSCMTTEIEISVSTDAMNPTFAWETGDGNILMANDLSSIQLNQPGTYSVSITDGVTGCVVEDQITIAQDADLPIIDIAMPDQITCDVSEVLLIATVDNIGSDVEFVWTTNDGLINSPNGAANITAGSSGEYTLSVINNENGCSTTSTIEVVESISTIVVEIDMPTELDCNLTELTLSATAVNIPNVSYVWTTLDGNIVSGDDTVNPIINQAGEYILTITDLDNACSATNSVTVEQDEDVPAISIAMPDQITCDEAQVTIDAMGSSEGIDFLTVWTTDDGSILSGENGLTPTVNSSGLYTLTISNLINNCVIAQDVFIEIDMNAPEVEILPFNDISCDNPTVMVTSNNLGVNTNLIYEWSTSNGTINGSATDPNVEVTAVGDYTLLVTNPDNGCFTIIDFPIEGSSDVPDVSIEIPAPIDCEFNNSVVELNLPADAQNLIYSWGTQNGNISGPLDEELIIANSAGLYEVTVTDINSNCEVVLNVQVDNNAEVPELDFIQPNVITCANPVAVINTQTLINGLIYEWSTTDGNIESATNGEDIVVNTEGTYSLLITNPANNCTNMISVEVLEDVDLPIVDIQPAQELTCIVTEQTLSTAGSSTGAEFLYQWTSQNGQIISGEDTPSPLINAPGLYILEILNADNQCKQVDSVFISENTLQPLAAIETPAELNCIDELVTIESDIINTDDLVLEWTTSTGNIISDPSETAIEVDLPGIYELSIVDQNNGCDNLITATVAQNTDEPLLTLGPGFTLTCDMEQATLSILEVDPNAQITWSDEQLNMLSTDNVIEVTEPGVYTVTALFTDTGCETIRTVEVLKNENVPTDLIANINPPLCFGDEGSLSIVEVLGGEGPYLYSIDGGQTFGDLTGLENLAAGSVTEIIALDANGCTIPSEFVMPSPIELEASLPSVVELTVGDDYQIQVQTNIPTNEIETITWTPAIGLSCTDCLNPSVVPINNINYEVEIITTNGCIEIANIQFRVDRNVDVYIPNAFSPFNGDGVNDSFYLFAKEGVITTVQSLQIYDRWGNQLFINENFNPNESVSGWNGEFRGEKMQPGVYVYYALVEYADGSTELFKGDLTLME